MKNYKILAFLMAILMVVSVCAFGLADEGNDDVQYEDGNPPISPEFYLRSNPDAGSDWSFEFATGDIVQINAKDYASLKDQPGFNNWAAFPGEEGGVTLLRLDGVAPGFETLKLTSSGEDAMIFSLDLVLLVDEALNVTIVAVGTNGVVPPETVPNGPVHPVLMLKSNPTTGYTWLPDNSYTPGLTIENEYIADVVPEGDIPMVGSGGVEQVTLTGKDGSGETSKFSLLYTRTWESDDPFCGIQVAVLVNEDTSVNIYEIHIGW